MAFGIHHRSRQPRPEDPMTIREFRWEQIGTAFSCTYLIVAILCLVLGLVCFTGCSRGSFSKADKGKAVYIQGSGFDGHPVIVRIVAYVDSNTVILSGAREGR